MWCIIRPCIHWQWPPTPVCLHPTPTDRHVPILHAMPRSAAARYSKRQTFPTPCQKNPQCPLVVIVQIVIVFRLLARVILRKPLVPLYVKHGNHIFHPLAFDVRSVEFDFPFFGGAFLCFFVGGAQYVRESSREPSAIAKEVGYTHGKGIAVRRTGVDISNC